MLQRRRNSQKETYCPSLWISCRSYEEEERTILSLLSLLQFAKSAPSLLLCVLQAFPLYCSWSSPSLSLLRTCQLWTSQAPSSPLLQSKQVVEDVWVAQSKQSLPPPHAAEDAPIKQIKWWVVPSDGGAGFKWQGYVEDGVHVTTI